MTHNSKHGTPKRRGKGVKGRDQSRTEVGGGFTRVQFGATTGDYSEEETAFLKAIEAYKARYGRPYPTWCEVLQVLKSLGYAKDGADVTPTPPEGG